MKNLEKIQSLVTQSVYQVTNARSLIAHLELLREILATALSDDEQAGITLERFLEA